MLRIFTLIFTLISASTVLAKNHVILIGGGGEPAGPTTIFDYQLPRIGNYLRSSPNHQLDVSFNGGHETTERTLTESFPGSRPTNFTSQNYEALISKYERDIRNGTIRSGEKILLMINTHGAESQYGETTHSVSTSVGTLRDHNKLTGTETVSLDRLKSLSQLAEQKGIKLGIVDFSCHSGASIKLGNSRTCVISASGENSYAYAGNTDATFASQFTGMMAPGKNLEEVFLAARVSSRDKGFPEISSPEGIRVQNQLYPVLRSYINSQDPVLDKFTTDILDSIDGAACIMERQEVQELIQLSRNLDRVRSHLNLEGFRNALQAYSDYRRSVQRDLVLAGGTIINEEQEICSPPGACSKFSNATILSTDSYALVLEYRKKVNETRDSTLRNRYQNLLNFYVSLMNAKTELFRIHPGMRNYNNFFQNYPKLVQRTNELADKVAFESRKLYSAMYHPNTHHTTNACREFTL